MEVTGFTRILDGSSGDRTTYFLAVTALSGFVLWLIIRLSQKAFRRLPPGPKGLPLIGDLLHISDQDWLTSPERVVEYGDTLKFNLSGNVFMFPSIRRNDVYKRTWEWCPYPQ